MPNWCYNTLEISGEPKQINKLIKKVEVTNSEETEHREATIFSFEKIIPMPAKEKDNWYEWRIANWGTKWNADIEQDNFSNWENGQVSINFNTAWSPPLPVMQALAKEFKKLNFELRFYEESSAYWGEYSYEGGEVVNVNEGDFSTCEEYKAFGLTHHVCKVCENWLDEFCNDTNDQEVEMCPECQEAKDKIEKEVWQEDEQLWEGEPNAKEEINR